MKTQSIQTPAASSAERQGTMSPGPVLRARQVTLGYGRRVIVENLSFEVPPGEVTVIIGPNGCGKSTLLRGFSRLLKPTVGSFTVGERELSRFGAREFARVVGLLPQNPVAPDGILVGELVSRGRYPHQGMFSRASQEDDQAVAWALEATSTASLVRRPMSELSGGQRQRVWIAMALAQQTEILLLDEPTTFLDLAHQVELLDLVVRLNRERGTTTVVVLHELNLAARAADHLVAMKDGAVVAHGRPEEVLTTSCLQEVFDLEASVHRLEGVAEPVVVPASRREERP